MGQWYKYSGSSGFIWLQQIIYFPYLLDTIRFSEDLQEELQKGGEEGGEEERKELQEESLKNKSHYDLLYPGIKAFWSQI